jgi:hypothetical protein
MDSLGMLAMFALAAFLVAWVANGAVGIITGEKPQDTSSLWFETFLRIFTVLELGWIGRLLNYVGLRGVPRKIVLFLGLFCVLVFLLRDCRSTHSLAPVQTIHVNLEQTQ